jgi:hypothetical protein
LLSPHRPSKKQFPSYPWTGNHLTRARSSTKKTILDTRDIMPFQGSTPRKSWTKFVTSPLIMETHLYQKHSPLTELTASVPMQSPAEHPAPGNGVFISRDARVPHPDLNWVIHRYNSVVQLVPVESTPSEIHIYIFLRTTCLQGSHSKPSLPSTPKTDTQKRNRCLQATPSTSNTSFSGLQTQKPGRRQLQASQ